MVSDSWGLGIRGGATDFPYVRRIGHVALIGVNSAVPTRLFLASGRVGPRQMRELASVLTRVADAGLIRVVLIHHPPLRRQAPSRRRLEDATELAALLKTHGADLVLHGHNHRDELAWTDGPDRQRIPIVGVAAGSTGRPHPHEPLARYNVYSISGVAGAARIELVTRGLKSAAGSVVELRRQVLTPDATLAASGVVMAVP
jgi:3',5'-cyclic AMP phosphodiesterase CpdA